MMLFFLRRKLCVIMASERQEPATAESSLAFLGG